MKYVLLAFVKDRLLYFKDQVISTFKKVFLYILVGIPMYADIFGTIPIAEALLSKGALLGTFIAICTAGIIIVGYGFNAIAYLLV